MNPVTFKHKKRILYLFAACVLVLTLLVVRLAWIQIVDSDELKEKAIEQQTKDVAVEAKRGNIYDRNGTELATSAACFHLWVRPAQLKNECTKDGNFDENKFNNYAKQVGDIVGMKQEDVLKKFNDKSVLLKVAKYLDKDKAEKIRKLDVPALELSEANKRYYPLGNFASQLLGSVNDDNAGRSGIELEYDQYLSGVAGRWIKNTDNNGDELSFGTESYYEAENGCDVVLTIDQAVQYYVESALQKAQKENKSNRMMAIAMSPKTGEILAMAVNPGFDPNEASTPVDSDQLKDFNKIKDENKQLEFLNEMWRNPLIQDTYEPGSTFKLLTATSALESGAVTTKDKLYCEGSYDVEGMEFHCADNMTHGGQLLKEAVANSCNIAHAQLALKMGADTFYDYLALFGITSKTGIDYPGEALALMQDRETIGKVGLATVGFGQGIAVTPIQLITAVSTIGNKGNLVQPHLVKQLKDQNGSVIRDFGTNVTRKVVSEETAKEMCQIMEYEVNAGTGSAAKIEGYRVGGKTGTANKASDGGYSEDVYSSFICMAPMDDPQIALLVICDTPRNGQYGSLTSAPFAKQILQDTLKYLGVEPVYTNSEKKSLEKDMISVPKVVGDDVSEAKSYIEGKDLKVTVVGKGKKVLDQYPKAGEKVSKDSVIYLYTE